VCTCECVYMCECVNVCVCECVYMCECVSVCMCVCLIYPRGEGHDTGHQLLPSTKVEQSTGLYNYTPICTCVCYA
jgi:hypothetical protein